MVEKSWGESEYVGHEVESASQEQGPRFGRNVHVEIEFMRHEEPGKTPEGMSADYLTEGGRQKAAAKGKTIDKPVKGYSSPKLRAQETIDLQLQNVDIDEEVQVINQRQAAAAGPREFKTVGEIAKGQKPENVFNIRVRSELDVAANFAKIMPECQAWAKEQVASGSKRSVYDLVVQYYLDHPERAVELGVTTPEESARKIAFAADREIRMTPRLYSDSDIKLLNGTHGPNLEPFLQKIIGFKSLEEIGGALNPGEGFKLDSKTDSAGNQTVKLLFRDKEYPVDTEQIRKLAAEFRNSGN